MTCWVIAADSAEGGEANPTATALFLFVLASAATAPPSARKGLGPHSAVDVTLAAFPNPTRATYLAFAEGAVPTRTALDWEPCASYG